MKINHFILILLLSFLLHSCAKQPSPKYTVHPQFETIEWLFNRDSDSTYLVNFWATTCPPCIKEMKWFGRLADELKGEKFQIDLINIDGAKRVQNHVFPFLHKKKIPFDVYILTDDNYTKWTDKVNPKWYGALPYTVIYRGKRRAYFFGAFDSYQILESNVKDFLD